MTARGADSSFVRDLIARLNLSMKGSAEDFYRAAARFLCLSVDGAQARNPAYPEKYDERFSPLLGKGPAVKANANQRCATGVLTEALFGSVCAAASLPWQKYMSRADIQPGTTIDAGDHRAMVGVIREFFAAPPIF